MGNLGEKALDITDELDTAGPSLNTQITVVSLVSSLAVGLFVLFSLF